MFNVVEFKTSFSNNFVNSIIYALGNPSFLCVLGSRMIYNLKEAAELGQNEGTNYKSSSQPTSGIMFASSDMS